MSGTSSESDLPSGYLPASEFDWVRGKMPIACVDLLPWRRSADRVEVLLIRRRQRSSLTGWALVGGRILLDEEIPTAGQRHLRETLGEEVSLKAVNWHRPDEVVEYRRGAEGTGGGTFDPGQHSVALTYCVEVGGSVEARSEAIALSWFDVNGLPAEESFVFGQSELVGRLASLVGS